jgi:hypothetical protein
MSRHEDIDNAIWDDPDFEKLSPYATLLYLWSFTNPRCGMAGVYKVSQSKMIESKVPARNLDAALVELRDARFLFYEDSVLWVRSRVKRLRARSPQMAKSIARDIQKLDPAHPIRRMFLDEYHGVQWLNDTLSGPYAEGMHTVSEKPIGKPDSYTVSIPSPDPIDRVNGNGNGNGQGDVAVVVSVRGEVSGRARALADFEYWQARCNHPNAKPTAERVRKIEARYAEGYTSEQVRSAIDGAARGAYVDDSGKRFDDIELICRSGSKLESFIQRASGSVTPITKLRPDDPRVNGTLAPAAQAAIDAGDLVAFQRAFRGSNNTEGAA